MSPAPALAPRPARALSRARTLRMPALSRVRSAALLAAFVACVPPSAGVPAAEDAQAIREAREAQNAAIAAADFEQVATFWTDDVTIRSGLGIVVAGRDAYAAAFRSDTSVTYGRMPTTIEVSDRWPLAWEEGTWVGSRRATGVELLSGRYSAQWIRTEAGWKIRSELFVALDCEGAACDWPVSE